MYSVELLINLGSFIFKLFYIELEVAHHHRTTLSICVTQNPYCSLILETYDDSLVAFRLQCKANQLLVSGLVAPGSPSLTNYAAGLLPIWTVGVTQHLWKLGIRNLMFAVPSKTQLMTASNH